MAALGILPKRRQPDRSTVHRVGILKSAAIGDTLLLAGVFPAIRRGYPSAAVVLITGVDNAAVAPLFASQVDQHVVIDPRHPFATVRRLRALHLDVLIECGPWPRIDAIVAALSGARFRVGFRVSGHFRHAAFDRVVDHDATVHQIENFRRLGAAAGAVGFADPFIDRPRKLDPAELVPDARAVFHPWAGGHLPAHREWPTERWVRLAGLLVSRGLRHVLVTGGPGDVSRSAALVGALGKAGLDATNCAGRFSIEELADVLAESDVVISVNTGVMHLAALLGARTVGLHGPTQARRWGPVGPRVRSVSSNLPGCGFLDLGFEYTNQRPDCMDGIAPEAVAAAVDELLREGVA